ncbi:MAG TPA: hypothetical protein VGK83_02600, partial [Acidimicrobiia bacterium]
FPSWRPLAPMALVVGLIALLVVGLATGWWVPLVALLVVWFLVVAIAAGGSPLGVAAIAIMHSAYGIGLIRGLLRAPATVRAAVG